MQSIIISCNELILLLLEGSYFVIMLLSSLDAVKREEVLSGKGEFLLGIPIILLG